MSLCLDLCLCCLLITLFVLQRLLLSGLWPRCKTPRCQVQRALVGLVLVLCRWSILTGFLSPKCGNRHPMAGYCRLVWRCIRPSRLLGCCLMPVGGFLAGISKNYGSFLCYDKIRPRTGG